MTYIVHIGKLLYYNEYMSRFFQQLMCKLKLIRGWGNVYRKPRVMHISIDLKIVLVVMFTQK